MHRKFACRKDFIFDLCWISINVLLSIIFNNIFKDSARNNKKKANVTRKRNL